MLSEHLIRTTVSICLVAATVSLSGPGYAAEEGMNTCLDCHLEIEVMPEDYFAEDIHEQEGLSCAGCHGGDPSLEDMDESMSAEAGYIGIPEREEIPDFCARCHSDIEVMRVYQPRIPTDQLDQYWTSGHGQRLRKGEPGVAECASCHGTHTILPVDDPRSKVYPINLPATCNQCHGDNELMKPLGRSTDQFADYSRSVHGKALLEGHDLGAPACNDCHGNHGAAPPGAQSVVHICGSCHLNNMEYFQKSPMAQSFEAKEYHSCEKCHSNHAIMKPTDALLNVGGESLCAECHQEGDDGYRTASTIYHQLREVDSLYQGAILRADDIRVKGMNDIDIGYLLQESNQNLIQLRTLVHAFDADVFVAKAQEGIKINQAAIEMADQEVHEYYQRRRGFGISALAFVLLAIGLFLKIREREKLLAKQSTSSSPDNQQKRES